jgi:competence protein ComEC
MNFHAKAFWAMSLFLVGVLCASAWNGVMHFVVYVWLIVALTAILLFLFDKKSISFLIFAIALGTSYYAWFDARTQNNFTAPIGKQIELAGIVARVSKTDTGQQVDLKISSLNHSSEWLSEDSVDGQESGQGVFRLYAQPYPEFVYGDAVKVTGTLKPIEGDSAGYYAKEGIGGIMSYPKTVDIIGHGQGSKIFGRLYAIRDYVRETFEKVLPPESAILMTGLVIGKSSGFSKEFSEKLKITGTTHLVALSGYNISIIITWLLALFGLFLRRKYAVWFCVAAVIGFVLMTGAEASVVRAAIMATIMVIAERTERVHSARNRNAIVFTALVMVFINPRVLAFDIGFQLSFSALLGIVYLKPAIEQLLHLPEKSGILDWRENLVTTCAAQLAVLPILLMNFGFITPIGIITNVLLLSFIPATTALGIGIIVASLISKTLAFFVSVPARIFLGYELWIIDMFSKFSFGFEVDQASFVFAIMYYVALAFLIFWVQKRRSPASESAALT